MIFDRIKITALILYAIGFIFNAGCTSTIEITKKVINPKFKLQSLSNYEIAGINVSGKKSVSELTDTEQSKLSEAIATKKFTSSFTLFISAKNPNDGNSGTRNMPVVLKSFFWQLLIGGKETVKGNIDKEIEIIADTVFTINISLDVNKYFPDVKDSNKINFAINLKDDLQNMGLKVKPIVETEFGNLITDEIIITNNDFR